MSAPRLRIGCIGWGSLLWDPRSLPLAEPFREDGPRLPIEFSRVALDGRVTLVIDPAAVAIQTYWAPLEVDTLAGAVEGLARREGIAPARRAEWVGLQTCEGVTADAGQASAQTRTVMAEWLTQQALDAVVWTALPARRPDAVLSWPGTEELVSHLAGLEGRAHARAEEYIRRAPAAVETPRRARFEAAFGWTATNQPPNPATPEADRIS